MTEQTDIEKAIEWTRKFFDDDSFDDVEQTILSCLEKCKRGEVDKPYPINMEHYLDTDEPDSEFHEGWKMCIKQLVDDKIIIDENTRPKADEGA